MSFSKQHMAFRRDKNALFSKLALNDTLDNKFKTVDARAQDMGYSFLLEHKATLETEFNDMFSVLSNQPKDEDKEIFWIYCYYCASLLETFYKAYDQQGPCAKYQAIKKKIKDKLEKKTSSEAEEELFIDSLKKSFSASFNDFIHAPFHISKIRDYIAYSNLCRLYWVFSRLTLTQGLKVLKNSNLINQLDAILGKHIDVDKIIATIQAPTFIINYFSVGFFVGRFLIDAGLLIRHTFFPTALEKKDSCEIHALDYMPGAASIEQYRHSYILCKDDEGIESLYYIPKAGNQIKLQIKNNKAKYQQLLDEIKVKKSLILNAERIKETITEATDHKPEIITAYERFLYELYKRHCNFANDLVWATVNFLSNFNYVVGISGPVASYLTAVFLIFDVSMLLYKRELAKKEFLLKKSQYLQEIQDYENLNKFKYLSEKQRVMHIQILRKQLIEAEIQWRKTEATLYFNAGAAALLFAGVTASLFVTGAPLVLACYFVALIAVAMYFSSDSYSKLVEQNLRLEQAQLQGLPTEAKLKAYQTARNDFIFTLAKNTVIPLVLMSTYAICWPAALVLTVLYMGYELYHAYSQHSDKKKAAGLEKPEVYESMESGLVPA